MSQRGMSLRKLIYSDYRRYLWAGNVNPLTVVFGGQGLWASTIYRVSHSLYRSTRNTILERFARLVCGFLSKFMELITGVSLDYTVEIGRGLFIPHCGNIFIGSPMGDNCNVSQGVTIGVGGKGDFQGVPTIGNRVFVGANAVLAGRIRIGDDVLIGPLTLVTRSIPDRAVVIGNPCKIAWFEGSFDSIHYDGMEDDPGRNASLAKHSVSASHVVHSGGGI